MPGLFKIEAGSTRHLVLGHEVALGLTLVASLATLVLRDPLALSLVLAASMVYLVLQVRLKIIALAYLFMALLAATALLCLWGLVTLWPALLRNSSLFQAVAPFERLAVTANLILPLALNASMAGLVTTLNRFHLPGLLKLPLLVTIRFIPTFLNDLKQLREAVNLRFRGRGGWKFWGSRPLLLGRVFLFPLVVRLIRSADELAVAAELKGLSVKTDFGSAPLRLSGNDWRALGATLVVIGGAFLWQVSRAAG